MVRQKNTVVKTILLVAGLAVLLAAISVTAQDTSLLQAVDKYLSNIHVKKYNLLKVADVNNQMKVRPNLILLDVRKPAELAKLGKLPAAMNIRLNSLAKNLDKLPQKDAAIIVYCKSGTRATYAACSLGILGYTNVKVMDGGFAAWTKARYKVEKAK